MTEAVTLGSVAKFSKGSGLSKSDLTPDGSDSCIHYGELFTQYGAVINEVRSRTNLTLPVVSRAGDVLMPTSDVTPRGLAKASVIQQSGIGLGGDVLIIRSDPKRVDGRFLAYAIRNNEDQVLSLVRGSTVFHLHAADMRNFLLYLPSLREQARIAEALEDADDLIDKLERMIAKKQKIRRGMLQQLLAGETRLPGFTESWHAYPIGNLCTFRSGRSKPRTASGRYWVIDMGSVTRDAELVVSRRTDDSSDLLRPGDLVMPKDDIGGGHIIGRTALIQRPDAYALADHVYALTPHGVDPAFLSLAINSFEVNSSLRSLATGSAQLGLSRSSVQNQAVRVPISHDEQVAIAQLSTDAETEIGLLRRRLRKAKEIKQGMMEQLLTGRTRMPVAGKAA